MTWFGLQPVELYLGIMERVEEMGGRDVMKNL
jgi:hypothetical protein